jgi:hypothetical protein
MDRQFPFNTCLLHPLIFSPSHQSNHQTQNLPSILSQKSHSPTLNATMSSMGLVPGKRMTQESWVSGFHSTHPQATSEDLATCAQFFQDMVRIGALVPIVSGEYVMIPEQEFMHKVEEWMDSRHGSGWNKDGAWQ